MDQMDRTQKPPVVLLVGPTAVGKTELALQLAERMNGEIVSVDSRLFYRGMDIGTAKPSKEEMARVPHHLIDIVNPDETLSLAVFQRMARDAIAGVHERGKLPFLTGGTGQYVRAVTQGWNPPEVGASPRMRDELERLALSHAKEAKEEKGANWLHDKLKALDVEAAGKIDARNFRRTIRALEVILTTGKKFSEQRGRGESPYRLIAVGLKRPREELYQRVDERIERMFADGLLDEVRRLLDKGYSPSLPSMSAIGYRECIGVIKGSGTTDQAKVDMRRATRVFIRRQANWFKESDPQIKWFDPARDGVEEIEAFVRNSL